MSEEKAGPVQWIQGSGGEHTCHVNDGRLNFKQSLIGTVVYRDGAWHVLTADGNDLAPEGFDSMYKARRTLEGHFTKIPVRAYGANPPAESAHEIGKTPEEIRKGRIAPRTAQAGKY